MRDFLQWLAGLEGIEAEPGTELRFELSAFPEGGSALLVLVGFAAALLAIAMMYRRDGRDLTRGQRSLLAALRCAAVAVALLLVLEPNLVAVKKEERPGHTILLIDGSQSMAHKDAFRRADVQPLAADWRALGVEDPPSATRLELTKALLGYRDQRLLRELGARNKVLVYSFGSALEEVPLEVSRDEGSAGTEPVKQRPPRIDLGALRADRRYSNLGGAFRGALERSREAAIAGIVLLSDGRRNMGAQGAEIARLLAQRKVPHTFVLGTGDPSETQTVQLVRVEAPEKVFQKDPFRIRAQLTSQGYEATSVTVRLLREGAEGSAGEVIGTKTVPLGGATPDAEVEFDKLISAEAGVFTYRVELQPPSGEPVSPERHVARTRIEVLGQQTRVLLIAGGPSHEYRVLERALTRDKSIELRCWLQSADPNFPQDGNVSIEALPIDRAEMEPIDVLILLDPDAAKLTEEFCQLAARHVLDDGAGLWWVCGEKYTLDALRDGATTKPLAALVPVVPDLVTADRRWIGYGHAFERAWPYELTPEGRDHKVVRLLDRKNENELLWPRLPGYHFAFPVLRAKPLAKTLVRLTDPRLARSQNDTPLIAAQFVGAGRALFTGTDETYRWRSLYEDAYDQFWVKGIRFLFEGRLTAGNSRLRIRVSEDAVELGEPVQVSATALDEAYRPLTSGALELRLQRQGDPAESIQLAMVEGVPGEYEATLRPRKTGFYTLSGAQPRGRSTEVSFRVSPAAVEREGPVELSELSAIASAPGGELFESPQQLLAALDRLPSLKATDTFRTPHAIWDTWFTIAIVLSLLSLEWWLRKRFNLL